MSPSEKAEDAFIQRYFASLASGAEALGLHDDAAQIPVPDGQSLIVSTDTLVSDVHFFDMDPPKTIAQKALRVNLSDLAAKGCDPKGYFLSLAMPEERLRSDDWMSAFAKGLEADQCEFGIRLMGGDTVRTSGFSVITICAFGFVPNGKMVTRSGAKPGHVVYVTGTIGDSAIGLIARGNRRYGQPSHPVLSLLTEQELQALEQRYLVPQPRNKAASNLQAFASASMDISDGLLGDANSLSRASNVALEIQLDTIPFNAAFADKLNETRLLEKLIAGGDDYEILCTVPAENGIEFERRMQISGVIAKAIGQVVEGQGVSLLDHAGQTVALDRGSFDHFS